MTAIDPQAAINEVRHWIVAARHDEELIELEAGTLGAVLEALDTARAAVATAAAADEQREQRYQTWLIDTARQMHVSAALVDAEYEARRADHDAAADTASAAVPNPQTVVDDVEKFLAAWNTNCMEYLGSVIAQAGFDRDVPLLTTTHLHTLLNLLHGACKEVDEDTRAVANLLFEVGNLRYGGFAEIELVLTSAEVKLRFGDRMDELRQRDIARFEADLEQRDARMSGETPTDGTKP